MDAGPASYSVIRKKWVGSVGSPTFISIGDNVGLVVSAPARRARFSKALPIHARDRDRRDPWKVSPSGPSSIFFGSSSTTSRFVGSVKYGSLSIIFSFMSAVRLVRLI